MTLTEPLAPVSAEETTVGELLGMTPAEDFVTSLHAVLTTFLKRRRENVGLTQTRAAELCKVTQQRYSNLETGNGKVSLESLFEAHINLGASVETLAEYVKQAGEL